MDTIIFTQNSQTATFTAQVTTKQDNGAITRFYNDLDKQALHVKASFIRGVEELVYICRTIQEKEGRAYKADIECLNKHLTYCLPTSFYMDATDKCRFSIKSKAKLDALCEDFIVSSLKVLARAERLGGYTCTKPEVIKASIPALINAISEGKEPYLTGKQAIQLKEISNRKISKEDITANWGMVRAYALRNTNNQ